MSIAAASLNRTAARPRHSPIIRITHWMVVLSALGLLVSGIGILVSHPRLYWGETGGVGMDSLIDLPIPFVIGPSVWNRPIHFFFAWILTFAGFVYVVNGFATRHFRNDLLPGQDLRSTTIKGVTLDHLRGRSTRKDVAGNYNVVQRLTYLVVVFALFPAIIWTGLAMSFGVTSVFPVMAVALGGHQSARTLHFAFVVLLLLFVAVHLLMVYIAGFVNNVRAMTTGYLSPRTERSMNNLFTRRKLITTGLSTAAGASGVGIAAYFVSRNGLIPPDHTGILGIGETLTYSTQRLLTSSHSRAREFKRSGISKIAPVNGPHPTDEKYRNLLTNGFKEWHLSIEGLVGRPASLSLEELKRLPSESHIILHACEEGWSYIAEWTGVRLASVLDLVETRPEARYVVFEPFPNPRQSTGVVRVLGGSIDMADALHPQTILAYGMNGEPVPADHGAPVRLRLGRHLGYKNTKYLSRIVVTDRIGVKGSGTWYGGI